MGKLSARVERLEAQSTAAMGDPPDAVSVYDAGAGVRRMLTWPAYQSWRKDNPAKDTITVREVIGNEQARS